MLELSLDNLRTPETDAGFGTRDCADDVQLRNRILKILQVENTLQDNWIVKPGVTRVGRQDGREIPLADY